MRKRMGKIFAAILTVVYVTVTVQPVLAADISAGQDVEQEKISYEETEESLDVLEQNIEISQNAKQLYTASNDYTQWKQYDAEWNQQEAWPANQYPNATLRMMSQGGCAVTSIAMLLRHYNVVTTADVNQFNPWICNETLKNAGAFTSSADLYWSLGNAYPGFVFQGEVGYSLSQLSSLYSQGYACMVQVNGSGGYTHYVAVRNVSGSTVTIMDPGSSSTNLDSYSTKKTILYWKVSGGGSSSGGGTITPVPNSNPEGCLDIVTGGNKSVYVRGWAFDRSSPTESLEIHVYVGGPYNSGAPGYKISANKLRTDVNAVFPGVGDYHGFDETISVDVSGTQTVYVYAINIGGYASIDYNTLLGTGTVTITTDSEAPKITNARVSDVSSAGYTITCTVTDNVAVQRVQFPTWTIENGQDDMIKDWRTSEACSGTISGTTVTYRVNASDHNNETGRYETHIYAFDTNGNYTKVNITAWLGNSALTPVDTLYYNGHTYELYDAVFYHWTEAKTYCESQGGHLVSITSEEEQKKIESLLSSGSLVRYWIGATDESAEGKWSWVTGESMNYVNWEDSQPDNANNAEHYGEIVYGKWNDQPIFSESPYEKGFILERDEDKHVHNYTSKITKQPTCTTNGVRTYTCVICGATKTETIKATGHVYGEWTITKEPTTTAQGTKERICQKCGNKETQSIPKLTNGGWKQDSQGWWYENTDGTYPVSCWKQIDGCWYYFNVFGYRVTGWQNIKNVWYYFDSKGIMQASKWIDNTYYVKDNGAMATGWLKLSEGWYYLNSSGKKLTGWQKSGNKWYYLDKQTGIMQISKWIDNTYYVNQDGTMATGWLQIGSKWYYLSNSGAKVTGWQKINNVWYYFDISTGVMYESKWLQNTYYLKAGGAMATGWQLIGSNYYYFDANGKKVTNKWVGNYYLKADGVMARSEWVDNGKYYVDENGKWVPGKTK